MLLLRRITGAAVVSPVNLVSVGLGFWAYHLLGSREQIAAQIPVALVTGTHGAHYAATEYPMSFGIIVGVWAIQLAENSLAMPVAAAWLRSRREPA